MNKENRQDVEIEYGDKDLKDLLKEILKKEYLDYLNTQEREI